jgi:hypothetical protein
MKPSAKTAKAFFDTKMATEQNGPDSEIYTYKAPWPLYSMAWNVRPGHPFRLAVGSFVEEYTNKV